MNSCYIREVLRLYSADFIPNSALLEMFLIEIEILFHTVTVLTVQDKFIA
jgi:hypothetical protein